MIGAQSKKLNFSVVDDEEDVIGKLMLAIWSDQTGLFFLDFGYALIAEKEQRMRKPLHKRLQYVAGWNIHDLVQGTSRSHSCLIKILSRSHSA